eukprot:6196057-Alexandrium_andersonii.AAC.1
MSASLVGSEMCIRDRLCSTCSALKADRSLGIGARKPRLWRGSNGGRARSVSYTHLTLPTICSV